MDPRRELLLKRLAQRRRRLRLMLVCLGTALVCGVAAVSAGPRILIGSVAGPVPQTPAAGVTRAAAPAPSDNPLHLSERLRLDPRETKANAVRWASMSEAERRQVLAWYWRLVGLSPADQDRVFEQYAAFRELPETRQEFLRTRAQHLREFMQSLSPQDQAVLESMDEMHRAQRLLELWQARHKTW